MLRRSPARDHFIKTLAAENAARDESGTIPTNSAYEQMLLQLVDHQRQLKHVQSKELKAKRKADFLPLYEAYVDGVLTANTGQQDNVLMTIMVWRIDAGDLEGALQIGAYALKHNLATPEQYKRDTATLLVEEVADHVLHQVLSNDDQQNVDSPDLENLKRMADLVDQARTITAEHDMPDEVRAKMHKAIGLCVEIQNPDDAKKQYERALQLDEKSGVKKFIERVGRAIKNAGK